MKFFLKFFLASLLSTVCLNLADTWAASSTSTPMTTAPMQAQGITVITLKDSINPGSSLFIERAIKTAEKTQHYLVIELNTPGGLLTATRDIVSNIMSATIPVIVYVTPAGAQAASAGMIITIAAHYAAMSPGTNIGAAHPVSGGGGKMDETMEAKVVNDTVAFVRSISLVRKRNTQWIEKGVKESASIPAQDALANHVIDGIYDSRTALFQALVNKPLTTQGDQTWQLPPLDKLTLTELTPKMREQIISLLGHPNIAFMLLGLGGLGLYVEFTHPGLIFPGVAGGISLLLGLVSLQMLPVRWGALALFFLGLALLLAELFVPSFGVLGLGGMTALILGSIYLFDTSQGISGVDLKLIIGFAVGIGLIFLFIMYSLAQLRRAPKHLGGGALDGQIGHVSHFDPVTQRGSCYIHGEIWQFSTPEQHLASGDTIVVEKTEGNNLIVSKKG